MCGPTPFSRRFKGTQPSSFSRRFKERTPCKCSLGVPVLLRNRDGYFLDVIPISLFFFGSDWTRLGRVKSALLSSYPICVVSFSFFCDRWIGVDRGHEISWKRVFLSVTIGGPCGHVVVTADQRTFTCRSFFVTVTCFDHVLSDTLQIILDLYMAVYTNR